MICGPSQSHRAAIAVAQNNRFVGPELLRSLPLQIGLLAQAGTCSVQPFSIAETGAINDKDAVIFGQSWCERKREIPCAAAGAVDQDHWRAAAHNNGVNVGFSDTDNLALRRKTGLGPRFLLVGAQQNNNAEQDECGEDQDNCL